MTAPTAADPINQYLKPLADYLKDHPERDAKLAHARAALGRSGVTIQNILAALKQFDPTTVLAILSALGQGQSWGPIVDQWGKIAVQILEVLHVHPQPAPPAPTPGEPAAPAKPPVSS